ncbi:GNAT family N-acetyltransferase [Acidaminobacter sp. JC074]|uniref:GNAT family N-acetyltransferase n=1 Tax=Acidaminobacter sp. JC074 TaxID=2530199 RepID=UPI001F0F519A|nr:GNAT family N-acetyltransferase [Acidaminobacter sp. JC074]MCH4885926.1 GNAT family N-acetyltransferase [Acidaminobacter sp. JC074]
MNLKHQEDGDKYLVENDIGEIIGEGIIREFEASRLYDRKRINYYIHTKAQEESVKLFLVESFIKMAKLKRLDYPDHDARIYNCCLSHDMESILFYEKVKAFKHDEGMWVLRKYLEDKLQMDDREIVCDNLKSDNDILHFIKEHSRIFVSVPYSLEKIRKLQRKNQLKSFGLYDKDVLIANVLLLKEDNQWWIEDLFVSSDFRKKGLASRLMNFAHNYLIDQGCLDVRLEVWSANKRAVSFYGTLGYEFINETESSIGMFI